MLNLPDEIILDAYLNLNKMTEYTLKPAIMPPKPAGWRKYLVPEGRVSLVNTSSNKNCCLPVKSSLSQIEAAKRLAAFFRFIINRKIRPTVFIIYASITGVTAAGAKRLATLCRDQFRVQTVNAADWDPVKHSKQLISATVFLCLTSTYGSGNIPHHASNFLTWINAQKETQLLTGVRYSVLGFGSSAFPRFCEAAVTFDRILEDTGCVRIAALGKVDALDASELTFVRWVAGAFSGLSAAFENHAPYAIKVNLGEKSPIDSGKSRKIHKAIHHFLSKLNPNLVQTSDTLAIYFLASDSTCTIASKWPKTQTGVVSSTRVLFGNVSNGHELSRIVTLIDVDVTKVPGGAFYSPGDNVAIFPRQTDSAITRAAKAFGIETKLDIIFGFERSLIESTGNCGTARFPTPTNVRTALGTFLGIESRPTVNSILELTRYADEIDATKLSHILNDTSGCRSVDEWLQSNYITWVTFFERFTSLRVDYGGVPLSILLNNIPLQHPRYYSIASSTDVTPGKFTLIVGQHSFVATDRSGSITTSISPASAGTVEIRHGTCTSYIRGLQEEDKVEFQMIPVRSFRLPISYSDPIVCISTGTGFAPINGFVKQRMHRMIENPTKLGEFIIIHGARDESETTFINDLGQAVAPGTITAIHFALSRSASAPKQYVQDLILSPAVAAQLRYILTKSEKSSVYVCGDANMAQSVRVALSADQILSPQGLRAMVDRGTYHEEIFGIFNAEKK